MSSLLNRFSFLVFNTVGPEASDLMNTPAGAQFQMASVSVIIIPNETYAFYIATPAGISLGNAQIDLVQDNPAKTLALSAVGTLTEVAVQTGVKHFTALINTIGNPVLLLERYYRFKIQLSSGTFYSNRVWLVKSGYASMSAVFSFRNTRPIGPIAYDLPALSSFRNILRLKCETGTAQTQTDVEEYERVTTGVKVMVEGSAHKYRAISCPRTDAIGHEGWATMLLHKDLLINDKAYSLKTGYTEGDSGLISNGSFEVWESDYSVVNRC